MATNLGLDDELRAIKALPGTDRTWTTRINDLMRKAFHSATNPFGPSSRQTSVIASGKFPVGGIMDFGSTSVPAGFVVCDGRSLSRVTYSDLFAVVGVVYGSDSAATFKVPDFRRRQAIGRTSSSAVGARSGAEVVVMTEANIPEHTHAASGLSADERPAHGHSSGGAFGDTSSINVQENRSYAVSPSPSFVNSSRVGAERPQYTGGQAGDENSTQTQYSSSSGTHSHATSSGTTGFAGSSENISIVSPSIVMVKAIYHGVTG